MKSFHILFVMLLCKRYAMLLYCVPQKVAECEAYTNMKRFFMVQKLTKILMCSESTWCQVGIGSWLNQIICKNSIADAPIIVYIHGGYWQQLTKDMSAYCVDPLVSNGSKVIVVEYDLCPSVALSEIVMQITKCGEFILKYAQSVKCRQVFYVKSIHLQTKPCLHYKCSISLFPISTFNIQLVILTSQTIEILWSFSWRTSYSMHDR